ncbi:MAG: hypothetical protein L6Q77_08650 [Bacteroidetes bacterium]|nr:hypothetical protein [Bacteroidota bacterium]
MNSIFLSLAVILVAVPGFSQTDFSRQIYWNQIFKPVLGEKTFQSDSETNRFNQEAGRLGMLNPDLIYLFIRSEREPESRYPDLLKTQIRTEILAHNSWVQNELADAENDPALSWIEKRTVSDFLQSVVLPVPGAGSLETSTPALSPEDSVQQAYTTFLYYTERSGIRFDSAENYRELALSEQENRSNRIYNLLLALKSGTLPESSVKNNLILSGLYSVRASTQFSGPDRIYSILAYSRSILDRGSDEDSGYLLIPAFSALPLPVKKTTFTAGAGIQSPTPRTVWTPEIDLMYAGKKYKPVLSARGPWWFISGGMILPWKKDLPICRYFRTDALVSLGLQFPDLPEKTEPISSPDPSKKNILRMVPADDNSRILRWQTTVLIASDAGSLGFLRFEAGVLASFEQTGMKLETRIKKYIDTYSVSANQKISTTELSTNSTKVSLSKSFTAWDFSPVLTVHTDLFGFTTLTTRVTYDRVMFSLEGWYP